MQLAQAGLLNQTDARLLHQLGERVRTLLQSYFRSPSELFVSFTHLVCRSAIAGTCPTISWGGRGGVLVVVVVGGSSVNLNGLNFRLLSGDQEGRLDLSHPVHVDNCLLEPDTRQCWREPPAFIHRDLRYVSRTAPGSGKGSQSAAAAAAAARAARIQQYG